MQTLLCCIGRRENDYIREYVEYYKKLGVTNICLIDNNYDGEEDYHDVIGDYIESGFVILKDYRNQVKCQMKSYEDCYNEYGDKYDWLMFFDCDEFLTLEKKENVESYLSSILFKKVDCIKVNWMIYGDGGLVKNDGRPLLERVKTPVLPYDKHVGYNFPENLHTKSIVRGGLKDIKWTGNPHKPDNILNCCDASGRVCDGRSIFIPYIYSDAYLRHYSTKTAEEYCNKMIKGFPDREWNIDKEAKFLIETRFFRYNEVTQEKVDMFNEKLGINLQHLVPHKDYTGEKSKDVKIYSLCYAKKGFDFLDDAVITPLQVGAALNNQDVCKLKDNTGDNISHANFFFIENTGIYWIWKNTHGCKYKGQMQYRRPLEGINDQTNFDEIFSKYDVITCEPFHHPDHKTPTETEKMVIPADTVEEGYAFSNCSLDLEVVEHVIKERFPEYAENYDKYIKKGEDLYYSNGFILKEADYDKYCEFLFKVLGGYLEMTGIQSKLDLYFHVGRNLGAGYYSQRYPNPYQVPKQAIQWQTEIGGFLSERIFTLWLLSNFEKDKIYTRPYVKQEEGMYT